MTFFASRRSSAVSSCGDRSHLARRLHGARRGRRAAVGAEAAGDHADEVAVHRRAHDVRQNRAARSDQRADDDQEVVRQHETGGRRRPSRVAVQHRNHHRHVRAADRHHHVDAEQERDDRHHDHRRHRVGHAVRVDERITVIDDDEKAGEVEPVSRRQQHRLAGDPRGELAEGDHRAGEGHGTDQHAEVHLDFVDGLLGRRHPDRHRRIDEVGVAHEHRGEADEAVHQRHQLGHLRHLHDARGVEADHRADDHRTGDVGQAGGGDLHAEDGGQHGDRHADHAVEIAAPRRLRVGQPAEAQDEEDGRAEIRDRRKAGSHGLVSLTCGTFRACAASPRSRRTC